MFNSDHFESQSKVLFVLFLPVIDGKSTQRLVLVLRL